MISTIIVLGERWMADEMRFVSVELSFEALEWSGANSFALPRSSKPQ